VGFGEEVPLTNVDPFVAQCLALVGVFNTGRYDLEVARLTQLHQSVDQGRRVELRSQRGNEVAIQFHYVNSELLELVKG